MIKFNVRRILALTVLGVASACCNADSVTVLGGFLNTQTQSANGSLAPSNPLNTVQTVIGGANIATSTYAFSNSALTTAFDHTRDGTQNSFSLTYCNIAFTIQPDAPGGSMTYALSGNYSATDRRIGDSGDLDFEAFLVDLNTGTSLLSLKKESTSTFNQAFVFGQPGGDSADLFSGNLSGSLIAGHTYEFSFQARTQAYPDQDSGAHAVGNIALAFSESSVAAPLPPIKWSAGTLLACLGGSAVWRKRRRSTLARA